MVKNLKRWTLLIFALALCDWKHLGYSQTVVIPPSWTNAEQVTSLLNDLRLPNRLQFATRTFIHSVNNVLPLKLGDGEKIPPMKFNEKQAYFFNYRLKDFSLSYRRWTLRHGYGKADFYDGNRDAAQLYLDTMSVGIDAQKVYNVDASLSRTSLRRWTIEYDVPLKRGQGQFSVAVHWLRVQRLQKGLLTGQMRLGQFEGDLHLLTTRGLPSDETRSDGLSLDISAIAPIGRKVKLGIWCENAFGKIWQRTLQEITAKVATNKVEPDADGFLHAVPFLQGRIEENSLEVKAKRVWNIGIALRQDSGNLIFMAKRERDWRISVGYSFSIGLKKRVWVMVSEGPIFWQVGINAAQIQLLLGADKWNASTAKEAMAIIRWFLTF